MSESSAALVDPFTAQPNASPQPVRPASVSTRTRRMSTVEKTRPKNPVGGPGWVNGSFTMMDSTRTIFHGAHLRRALSSDGRAEATGAGSARHAPPRTGPPLVPRVPPVAWFPAMKISSVVIHRLSVPLRRGRCAPPSTTTRMPTPWWWSCGATQARWARAIASPSAPSAPPPLPRWWRIWCPSTRARTRRAWWPTSRQPGDPSTSSGTRVSRRSRLRARHRVLGPGRAGREPPLYRYLARREDAGADLCILGALIDYSVGQLSPRPNGSVPRVIAP